MWVKDKEKDKKTKIRIAGSDPAVMRIFRFRWNKSCNCNTILAEKGHTV